MTTNHSVRPKNLGANGPPNGMPFFEYHWISLISLIASMVSQFFLLIAIKNLFLLTPDTKQHREVGSTSPICRVSQPRGQSTAWSCSAALISMIYALGHWEDEVVLVGNPRDFGNHLSGGFFQPQGKRRVLICFFICFHVFGDDDFRTSGRWFFSKVPWGCWTASPAIRGFGLFQVTGKSPCY